MKEENHWLPTSIGMMALFCIFAGIFIGAYPGWDLIGSFFEKNIKINLNLDQNAPAWVQAIFSLIAIVATGYGLKWQLKKNLDNQNEIELQNNRKSSDTCLEMCNALRSIVRDKEGIFYDYEREERLSGVAATNSENKLMWEKFMSLERIVDLQEVLRVLVAKDMPIELLRPMFGLQKVLAQYKEFLLHSSMERQYMLRIGSTISKIGIKILHSDIKKELNKFTKNIVLYKDGLK